MSLTLTIKGDTHSSDHVYLNLSRGKKRAERLTRIEFDALVANLIKNGNLLSKIGAGSVISVELTNPSNISLKRSTRTPALILINGFRPLALTKAEFFSVIRSPRIAQRALYWTRRGKPYVKIFREGGRGSSLLIDTESVETFYEGILTGCNIPPSMPCERQSAGLLRYVVYSEK